MNCDLTLNQLTHSENGKVTLRLFVGAHSFRLKPDENNLRFKFQGSQKANFCKIYLNGMDLYDVTFCMHHTCFYGKKPKTLVYDKKVFTGLFFDQLKEIFETYTGLYLSFN